MDLPVPELPMSRLVEPFSKPPSVSESSLETPVGTRLICNVFSLFDLIITLLSLWLIKI